MDKMVCKKCGKEVDIEDAFCRYCGNDLSLQTKEKFEIIKKDMVSNINFLKTVLNLNKEKFSKSISYFIKTLNHFDGSEEITIQNLVDALDITEGFAKILIDTMIETGFIKNDNDKYIINYDENDIDNINHCIDMLEIDELYENKKNRSIEVENLIDGEIENVLKALKMFLETGNVSITAIQREFDMGFPRAASILNKLINLGFISKVDGFTSRYKINITKEEFEHLLQSNWIPKF